MASVFLPDGSVIQVDPAWGPEEVQRRVREHQATNPQKTPVIPENPADLTETSGPRPEGSAPAVPDPSQHDDWGTYIDKHVKAAVRQGVGGIASTGDFIKNFAIDPLVTDYQALTGGPVPVEEVYDQPVREAYERNVIPMPEGSAYKQTGDVAEIIGPAVVETLLTGSPKSGPVAPTLKEAFKQVPKQVAKNVVKTTARTAKDAGAGYVGGEVGGAIGEKVGGEQGRLFGTLLGGAGAPAGTSKLAKTAEKTAFTNARSKDKLDTIEDFNRRRGPNVPELKPSLGLIGTSGASLLEDLTGRGVVSGKVAQESRRGQYAALEAGVQDVAEQVRGRPARGHFTGEDLGVDSDRMARDAQATIDQKITTLQNDLEQQVGSLTPTDPTFFENRLNSLIANRGVGEHIKDDARQLLRELKRNYPTRNIKVLDPATGNMVDVTIEEPPAYGAVKDVRSDLGRSLDAQGRPLKKSVMARGYKGLTEGMREAAVHKGVPADQFDEIQKRTRDLYRQANHVEKITGVSPDPEKPSRPRSERAAYNAVFGGQDKRSIDQLTPFVEHTPDQLKDLLADSLELRLRGESNAGLPQPEPETFDISAPRKEWKNAPTSFKETYTQGDPNKQAQLDNITKIAGADETRSGARTVPGKKGSTMGATAQVLSGPAIGAVLGQLHGGDLSSLLTGAVVAPALAIGTNAIASRYMTNPNTARRILNPQPSGIVRPVAGAVGGLGAVSGMERAELNAKAEAEAARRRLQEMYGAR